MSSSDLELQNFFRYKGLEMRPLEVAEITETVEHLNNAFMYQKIATGYDRTNYEHLHTRMKELHCYVITNGTKVVGTVAYEDSGKILHFGLVSVSEEFQGKDLGRAIMKAVEDFAHAAEYEILELDFMSIAPWLENYYKKYGFEKTGHTEKWKGVDLIQMLKKVTKN